MLTSVWMNLNDVTKSNLQASLSTPALQYERCLYTLAISENVVNIQSTRMEQKDFQSFVFNFFTLSVAT